MPEFRFAQICATFRLRWVNEQDFTKKFIIFQPNSIFSDFEIVFFKKIFVSVLVLLCVKILIRISLGSLLNINGSTRMTPEEVHHFSVKFYHFGLQNGIFLTFYFGAHFILHQNSNLHKFV